MCIASTLGTFACSQSEMQLSTDGTDANGKTILDVSLVDLSA